jgi:hypothetical protein
MNSFDKRGLIDIDTGSFLNSVANAIEQVTGNKTMKKVISIGLIGFGTIGTGVIKLLQKNGELIAGRLGTEIRVQRIADIDIRKSRGIPVDD